MKPNYKNWVPKGRVVRYLIETAVCLIATIVFGAVGFTYSLTWAIALFAVAGAAAFAFALVSAFLLNWHNVFSYDGKRQLSKIIIEGVAKYVHIPDGGKCLDVGCGTGALPIAIAKKNRNATVIGLDRLIKIQPLFEDNARAEGVENVTFYPGDAQQLPFKDETFDVVVSNYVYHKIPAKDRQALLLETLRLVKKGGTFVIHDTFTENKFGDMNLFIDKLKEMGYEQVELIDTTTKFMTEKEAKSLYLSGSAILYGKK